MKKFEIKILLFIIFLYFMASIIGSSFNCFKWDMLIKIVYAGTSVIMVLLGIINDDINKDINEDKP